MKRNLNQILKFSITVMLLMTLILTGCSGSKKPIQKDGYLDVSKNYTFKPVQIGGGGYVTGVVVHPTEKNLVYARTDVGGAYKWNAKTSRWEQLIVADAMPEEVMNEDAYSRTWIYGCEALAIAPSNPKILYVAGGEWMANGFLLKSTDQGKNFERLEVEIPMAGNSEDRMDGIRIAIDPVNENIVYYGTRNKGLFKSEDGGKTWNGFGDDVVSFGIDNNCGVNLVVFDDSTSEGKKTNRIYASVNGIGVYKTEDAGVTWEKISDIAASDMEVVEGVMYASAYNNGVLKYTPDAGMTTSALPNNASIGEIAVDPKDSDVIYAIDTPSGFNHFFRSVDGGATWVELDTNHSKGKANFKSENIPWVESSTVRDWLSAGELVFDPADSSKLWLSEGMGMWLCENASNDNNAPVFNNISQGIEEMVSSDVEVAPGGTLLTGTWDRIGFAHEDLDTSPATQVGISNEFAIASSIDICPTDPYFAAAVVSDMRGITPELSGYTTDGGKTWNKFGSETVLNDPDEKVIRFGEIAVSANDVNNMVWVQRDGWDQLSGDYPIYYTTTRGMQWKKATITGYLNSTAAYLVNKRVLAADSVDANVFYLYSFGEHVVSDDDTPETINDPNGPGQLFVSTDGGSTFNKAEGVPPARAWHGQMKSAPGKAGNLWISTGTDYSLDSAGLYYTEDAGKTFNQVENITNCWALGFGKAKESSDYPTVFIYGSVKDQWGLFRSTDKGDTWELCVDYPLGIFDKVNCINGDPYVFGKVYVGFNGNSFAYGTTGETKDTYEMPEVVQQLEIPALDPVAEVVVDPNKLKNPSFEKNYDYWTNWGGENTAIQTEVVNSGEKALLGNGGGCQWVRIKPDTTYKLGVWAKYTGTETGDIFIKVHPLDSDLIDFEFIRFEPSDEMTYQEITFTIPTDILYEGPTDSLIGFWRNGEGDFYLDDFVFEEVVE